MTSIIYNNVNKRYAKLLEKKASDSVSWDWVSTPEEATTFTPDLVQESFRRLELAMGPSMDGALEIRDQIAEVKRRVPGRYQDSEEYENGDDTDIA